MRKTPTLCALADRSVIQRGTVIEIVPEALPQDASNRDPRTFRALIIDPWSNRDSIRWELDGQLYSPSGLAEILFEEHDVAWLKDKYLRHWRREGADRSLWEEAEDFPR